MFERKLTRFYILLTHQLARSVRNYVVLIAKESSQASVVVISDGFNPPPP